MSRLHELLDTHVNKTIIFQRPGQPHSEEIKSCSVKLTWKKSAENPEYYQIRYKSLDKGAKWNFTDTNSNENMTTVSGLLAYKQYKFQVRGIFGDLEGPYSDTSAIIETRGALTAHLVKLSKSCHSNSSKCIPPIVENLKARNPVIKTKQMTIGILLFYFNFNIEIDINYWWTYKQVHSEFWFYFSGTCEGDIGLLKEKTILLIGATGSGKSTLVDGFVNYINGVNFEDPFRLTAVTLENEEMGTDKQVHFNILKSSVFVSV